MRGAVWIALFFPLVLLNGWLVWLVSRVLTQGGWANNAWLYLALLAGTGVNVRLVIAVKRAARRFVQSSAPPSGLAGRGTWAEVLVSSLHRMLLVVAAGLAAFETLLGFVQPTAGTTFVITTFDGDGTPHDRVVSRLESQGRLYVAANHWPRAWYERALENPDVRVTTDGGTADHRAVPVTGAEHDRVDGDHSLGVFFRILTGFPPRYFLRLDPR